MQSGPTPAEATDATQEVGSSALPNTPPSARLQFSLRTLLAGMGVLSVLCGLFSALGQRWSMLAAWFLVLAAAHVAGNAWGSRSGRRRIANDEGELWPQESSSQPRPVSYAPATGLRETRAPLRPMAVAASLGALLGGAAGAVLLWAGLGARAGWLGLAVGGLSTAVLGAFLGLLASSFLDVALRAGLEAVRGRTTDGSQP